MFKHLGTALGLVAALSVASAAAPATVSAQTPRDFEQVDATPKATVGLGIIGAELGFVIPAVSGLHDTWAWIVFPVIGAAGGALGGYFGIDNNGHTEAAVGVLAAGLALIVPTMVLTLSQTAYDPEKAIEEAYPEQVDEARAPVAPRAQRRPVTADEAVASSGVVRMSGRTVSIGVPALGVRGAYSQEELFRNGLSQHQEVHLSLLSGSF